MYPQHTTVLDVKQQIHQKLSDLPPFLQRLAYKAPGGASTKLEDGLKLTADPQIKNGSVIFLARLPKFELYVHDARGNLHSLVVPSSEPEVHQFNEYQIQSTQYEY